MDDDRVTAAGRNALNHLLVGRGINRLLTEPHFADGVVSATRAARNRKLRAFLGRRVRLPQELRGDAAAELGWRLGYLCGAFTASRRILKEQGLEARDEAAGWRLASCVQRPAGVSVARSIQERLSVDEPFAERLAVAAEPLWETLADHGMVDVAEANRGPSS